MPPAAIYLQLQDIFKIPRILSRLLQFISFDNFRAISLTCSQFYNCLENFRDIVLARYVPGYQYAVRLVSMQDLRQPFLDVSLMDVELLQLSLACPVHLYPMHALSVQSQLHTNDRQTQKFVALAQSHSRFVLLLQSLVHTSNHSTPEPPPMPALPPLHNERKLSFPRPLSNWHPQASNQRVNDTNINAETIINRSSSKSQRNSLFKLDYKQTLPPRRNPHYTGHWKSPAMYAHPRVASHDEKSSVAHRRLENTRHFIPRSQSFITSEKNPYMMTLPHPHHTKMSPHNLLAALSRSRAPVLRAFVPCSNLSKSISLCEEQLDDLYQHLSIGDLVCNLGFVPPNSGDSPGSGSNGSSNSNRNLLRNNASVVDVWLLYDGMSLVVFDSTKAPPVPDPFSLPSPLYYSDIMQTSTNPRFTVYSFPPHLKAPQTTLEYVPTKVPSPHSPTGLASVQQYFWIARLWRGDDIQLGEGWRGLWILQGQGTREGRQFLLDCLANNLPAHCYPVHLEVVREKTGGNNIWLRILDI